MSDDFDAVVLGLGPGGESVASGLAEAGLRVAAVDQRLVGGECPYFGCIPSKMMIRAGNLLAEGRRVEDLAGSSEVRPDWSRVAGRIREEATDGWDDSVAVERLEKAGITFVRGHGRLAGPGRVDVEGRVLTARRGVLLNTGTEPAVPPVDGLAETPYWTNRDAVRAEELPASLVVVGGGAIGLELAQAFSRFGVTVTVLEVADRLLAVEEPEAGSLVADVFEREGIDTRVGAGIESVRYDAGQFAVSVDGEVLHAERLLLATGRRPNLADVGLDTVGLDPAAKAIGVDEHLRAADGVWAIGDITGKGGFTHVSMYQADIALRDILGEPGPAADYRALPRVTFTDPEIGAVGMTEQQAREAGVRVAVGTTQLPTAARGWIHGTGNDGFVKLVADADRGVLVGATSAGPAGGEVLSMLTTAVHARVPVETLRSMIYAYPTFHRAVESALRGLG